MKHKFTDPSADSIAGMILRVLADGPMALGDLVLAVARLDPERFDGASYTRMVRAMKNAMIYLEDMCGYIISRQAHVYSLDGRLIWAGDILTRRQAEDYLEIRRVNDDGTA